MSFPLSSRGKIFRWQDISPFGKILDGAIRREDPQDDDMLQFNLLIEKKRESEFKLYLRKKNIHSEEAEPGLENIFFFN